MRDTGDGSLRRFSLAVFLFPGGPKPSRVVFSLGNWLILPENSASRATQRTIPCAESSPQSLPLEGKVPQCAHWGG